MRLRIGLVGAGLVGQAEHAFYLWEERERFDFVALAEPSASVRAAVGARYAIPNLHADMEGLFGLGLDAVVIAAPDAFHPDLASAALDAGLHVMCEKPLALTIAGCDQIINARDRSGRILQVAYMKRFDPAFRRALDLLPKRIEDIKLISVECERSRPRSLRCASADDGGRQSLWRHMPASQGRNSPPASRIGWSGSRRTWCEGARQRISFRAGT